MTTDQLKTACEAEPFQPFSLHLADGRSIMVHQPNLLVIFPRGKTVFVVQPNDTWNIIDLRLVTDLEFKASNGRSRRQAS